MVKIIYRNAEMEISFTNVKLAKLCNADKKLRGKYGARMADIIQQRLAELSGTETLEVMRTLPGANCHELKQNLKGWLAVNLVHPDRLVFEPDHEPLPTKKMEG